MTFTWTFSRFLNKKYDTWSKHWELGSILKYLISIWQLHGSLCPNFLKPFFFYLFLGQCHHTSTSKNFEWLPIFEDDFFLWPIISSIFFNNWIVYAKQHIKFNLFTKIITLIVYKEKENCTIMSAKHLSEQVYLVSSFNCSKPCKTKRLKNLKVHASCRNGVGEIINNTYGKALVE